MLCLAPLLFACLINTELYEERAAGFRDDDGDGFSESDGDCLDSDTTVHPGAAESCNEVDDDCDGSTDEDPADGLWYTDGDGDGYGGTVSTASCESPGEGWVQVGGDCDDGEEGVNPGAGEVCDDGQDNDCDADATECRLSGQVDLDEDGTIAAGAEAGDQVGQSLVSVPDMDGDGRAEVLIGAYGADLGGTDVGQALLLDGSGEERCAFASQTDYAFLGWSVASGEDFDGDGVIDLAVGANNDTGGGSASVFSGACADLVTEPLFELFAGQSGAQFGFALGPLLDLEDDGYADLLSGGPGWIDEGEAVGAVALLKGPRSGTLDLAQSSLVVLGTATDGGLGFQVDSGDLTGDGVAELILAAPAMDALDSPAMVLLMDSGLEGTVTADDADVRLVDETTGSAFGVRLMARRDLDQDGYGDLVLSAPLDGQVLPSAGTVYLVPGPPKADRNASELVKLLEGSASAEHTGSALTSGDIDGDGQIDLAIGASGASAGAGNVTLFYGPLSMGPAVPDATLSVEGSSEAGTSLDMRSDLSGDGVHDLLIGAPGTGNRAGLVTLVLGRRI